MSRILQALKHLEKKAPDVSLAEEPPANRMEDSQNDTDAHTTIDFADSVAVEGRRSAVDDGKSSETQSRDESPVFDTLSPATEQSSLTLPKLSIAESEPANPAYRTLAQLAASFASDVDLKTSLVEYDESSGIPDEPLSEVPAPTAEATAEQQDHEHPVSRFPTSSTVRRSPSDDSPDRDAGDPYRKIADSICDNRVNGGPTSVIFVHVDASDRIGSIVAQAGLMLEERDIGSILLVDANLISRTLTDEFTRISRVGLAEVLSDQESWKASVVQTSHNRLHLLPAGSMEISDTEAAASEFSKLMDQLKQRYQFVLVDAGDSQLPLAAALGRYCDLSYLLISLGQTEIDKAEAAVDRIRTTGSHFVGCIVTNDRNSN